MLVLIGLIINFLSVNSFNCDDAIFFLTNSNGDYIYCLDELGDLMLGGGFNAEGEASYNVPVIPYTAIVSDGINPYTLSESLCFYTQSNKNVEMWCDIVWTGKISILGSAKFLVSLPIKSNADYGYGYGNVNYLEGITFNSFIEAFFTPNSTNISFNTLNLLGTVGSLLNTNIATSGKMIFKVSYRI